MCRSETTAQVEQFSLSRATMRRGVVFEIYTGLCSIVVSYLRAEYLDKYYKVWEHVRCCIQAT